MSFVKVSYTVRTTEAYSSLTSLAEVVTDSDYPEEKLIHLLTGDVEKRKQFQENIRRLHLGARISHIIDDIGAIPDIRKYDRKYPRLMPVFCDENTFANFINLDPAVNNAEQLFRAYIPKIGHIKIQDFNCDVIYWSRSGHTE